TGDRWMAVGEQGSMLVSLDLVEWTQVPSPTTSWLRGFAHYGDANSGLWLVSGQAGALLYSRDGDSWRPLPNPNGFNRDFDSQVLVPVAFQNESSLGEVAGVFRFLELGSGNRVQYLDIRYAAPVLSRIAGTIGPLVWSLHRVQPLAIPA